MPSTYAFARGLTLVVIAIVAFFIGSNVFVAGIAMTRLIVQDVDPAKGAVMRDPSKPVDYASKAVNNPDILVPLLLKRLSLLCGLTGS